MSQTDTNAEEKHQGPRSLSTGRWRERFVLVAVALLCGAVLAWASISVFAPVPAEELESDYVLSEVQPGEVGSSMSLNTVAEWEGIPAGTNLATGVVTFVNVEQGAAVDQGSVLYSVNLRPTVIARGDVPSFRSLSRGVSGADVSQLQAMLASIGQYTGVQDGRFGSSTEAAVKRWQKSLAVPADGVVQAGDLVFVQSLPSRIALDTDAVSRGKMLAGGEEVVSTLPAEPSFRVPATPAQASSMPVGTVVEISFGATTWSAVVAGQSPTENEQVDVLLAGADGGTICADACAELPIGTQSLLPSQIITQPTVSGLVVPSAALKTRPDGTVFVVDAAGKDHAVTVIASAKGLSVVEGVAEGLSVRLPGSAGD